MSWFRKQVKKGEAPVRKRESSTDKIEILRKAEQEEFEAEVKEIKRGTNTKRTTGETR